MTHDQARDAVLTSLDEIAPDAGVATLGADDDLREALDLDSMDVFNLVAALSERTGVDIPDGELVRLTTLDGLVTYLVGAGS